jgi:hypothetical protein
VFDWLLRPSPALASRAEIAFDVGLIVATFVVVVGLIGEYRKKGWWTRHVRLAEMLVLYGVISEMFTEAGTFWYALRLQTIEESTIATTQTTAADAVKQAGKLGVTFDNLHAFVDQKEEVAGNEIQDFKTFSAGQKAQSDAVITALNADKKRLDSSLATVSKDQSELAAALSTITDLRRQIHELTTPRSITVAQSQRITELLKPFAKTPFDVNANDDQDSIDYAGQVALAMKAAGWDWRPWASGGPISQQNVGYPGSPGVGTLTLRGVVLQIVEPDRAALERPLTALAAALTDNGVPVREVSAVAGEHIAQSGRQAGSIHVLIGSKQ